MSDTALSVAGTRLLDRVAARVERARAGHVYIAALVLAAVRSGVWWQPNMSYLLKVAEAPTRTLITEKVAQYVYGSWLSPALAHVLGATGPWPYLGVHLVLLLAAWCVFGVLVVRRLDPVAARRSAIVFGLLPVSTTALYWVGPDAATLLLLVLLLAAAGHRGLPVLAGAALGMQHFEQGLVGLVAVLAYLLLQLGLRAPDLRTGAVARFSRSWAVQGLVGVVAGRVLLLSLFHRWGMHVEGSRFGWFLAHRDSVLRKTLSNPQVIVWSVLAVGWYLVARRVIDGSRRERIAICVSLVICVGPIFIVGDQTRVGALSSFLLLAVMVLFDEDVLRRLHPREVSLLVLAAVVPHLWCWTGVPHPSALVHDVRFVLHYLIGWPGLPNAPWTAA